MDNISKDISNVNNTKEEYTFDGLIDNEIDIEYNINSGYRELQSIFILLRKKTDLLKNLRFIKRFIEGIKNYIDFYNDYDSV